MSSLPFSATPPIHISRVGLRARDGERLADYYKNLLGLQEVRREDSVIGVGTAQRELLEIATNASLRADDPHSAGLFHTAFLLPTRADLSRWARHAMARGIRIEGASDHHVSEAFYLTDPEGNGIEIYADRPRERWSWADGQVEMVTEPLGIDDLLSESSETDADFRSAPEDSVIGHVHLRVGDAQTAERWWKDNLGLEAVAHYGDAATFMSSGGYHHHIGANMWRSRHAGMREADRTGLAFVELAAQDRALQGELVDPWGTRISVVEAR